MRRAESTGECAYLHPLRSRTSRPLRHNPDDLADSGLRARSELGCLWSYSSPSLLRRSTTGMRPRLRNRSYNVIADEHAVEPTRGGRAAPSNARTAAYVL